MDLIQKDFTPYPEALELKTLGFDEPCFGYWGISRIAQTEGEIMLETRQVSMTGNLSEKICLAPTYSQAFRWFREKHGMYYSIQIKDGIWFFEKWSLSGFKTYEEAELACLIKLIEIVKHNKI